MAGMLHDDLQQQLAALRMRINILMQESQHDANTKSLFQETIDLVDDAIEQTRSLSHELSPANLQLHGLFNSLNNLAKDMYEKHGLEVNLDLEPAAEPKKDNIVSMLYRALKELMFNVLKHSGQKEAWLKVKPIGDETCFSITDQGKGMTSEELHNKRETGDFLGLFGIEQRLFYLGGRMEIETSKEEGMRVILVLPTDKAKGLQGVEEETQSPALRNSFTSISEGEHSG